MSKQAPQSVPIKNLFNEASYVGSLHGKYDPNNDLAKKTQPLPLKSNIFITNHPENR